MLYQETQKPQQSSCCWICFKIFLQRLTYFYFPAWKFGLYCFHELAGSEETTRLLARRDYGSRRQQAAGDSGCIMTFSSFWPPCPAYVLPSLWPNGAAARTHQALAWALYKPNFELEVSEQSYWLVDSRAEVSFRVSGTVWDLPIPNERLLPHNPDSSSAFPSEMCDCISTEHGITLQKQPFKGLERGVPLCAQLSICESNPL